MGKNTSIVQHERRIIVQVDQEISDLIPGFLENRANDVRSMKEALEEGDYETIRVLGHRMKGNGAGYGFEAITTIGGLLERSAKQRNIEEIQRWINELKDYLERVEVRYE